MSYYVPAIAISLAGSFIVLLFVAHMERLIRIAEDREAERRRAERRAGNRAKAAV